ncbi:Fe(3+)-siderophore ABC transporter permease [Chitiniphilus eburneus]|uniref:Fe(3+)-siderophore ABC transporter permease n=1 Tax=Chitiniphilus eburneus TaxID=2571148 RepID=UPI0035D10C9F
MTRARSLWLPLGGAALLLLVIASFTVGAKSIDLTVVWHALLGDTSHSDSLIVREARLPRTLLGLLAGVALGLAGALIQALTRNPLADPGIVGVNAGASFAVVLAASVFGVRSGGGFVAWACGGALVTTLLVYLIGIWGASRLDPLRFLLAGVAVASVMFGLSSGLVLLDPGAFDRVRFWNAGSLDIRNLTLVMQVLPVVVAGSVLALLLSRPLNALTMGHDMAVALGARPLRTQMLTIIAVTLLTGAVTAVAGPIGFVGLMVPQAARWLVGNDMRWIMPVTVLLSPILLLAADIVGRLLLPGELPVSIVTALVGAPVLIWLVRSKIGGR